MRNIVFLDRDGTLIVEPPDAQIDSLEKLEFVPGIVHGLRLLCEHGYELVMVSNQDGLGTSRYPQSSFDTVQRKLIALLEGEGIHFSRILICPHMPKEQCACRKPKKGLVEELLREPSVTPARCVVIGDRETDVQFAQNIGCTSIRLTHESGSAATFVTSQFEEACRYIIRTARSSRIARRTAETAITAEVSLDGTGTYTIATGIGFFDHMLAQLSKHSLIDMHIQVEGDLQVDEHHTVEDTGLALGQAVRQALGEKRGIERYGFLLPMDEAQAQVALDLSDRPYFSFSALFTREKVGEFPTELTEDFFRAFADGLRANLHITLSGRNDHHQIEAAFKSVARALRQAVARNPAASMLIPSTKGIL